MSDEMAKANMRAVNQALINERDRLEAEIKRLREQVRQLEAERDQWQRQAVNNG